MAKKPELHLLKTNGPRQRRKDVRRDLRAIADRCIDERDVRGYAIVLFGPDGEMSAFWDTRCLGHASKLRADLAKRALERVEHQQDVHSMLWGDEET